MSYSFKDEEIKNREQARRNLAKAKKYEKKHKMYTYTTPDRRLTISCKTEDGLTRMKQTLGF